MAEPLLEVRSLAKAFAKGGATIRVLEDASLSMAQGEMVSIIGKSGSGKSTLLHLMGTLDVPDAGSIVYRGTNLVGLTPSRLADFRNAELGFVFQFHHLLPEFTALENVMMPALIRRMPRAEASRRAVEALEQVGLGHRMEHKPGELSGGEQQRAALARALVLEPPLLLADEVTGNLDDRTAEGIHQLLLQINQKRGTTIVVVTHNRVLADMMPRRLLLENGTVQERA